MIDRWKHRTFLQCMQLPSGFSMNRPTIASASWLMVRRLSEIFVFNRASASSVINIAATSANPRLSRSSIALAPSLFVTSGFAL